MHVLNGPQWLADLVAAMVALATLTVLGRAARAERRGYPAAVAKVVFGIALIGLLVPRTHLLGSENLTHLWIAATVVLTTLILVTTLSDHAFPALRWRPVPLLLIGVSTLYLLAAPSGIAARPSAGAMVGMSPSAMAGSAAQPSVVRGAPIDLFLALAMSAITVILIDRASSPPLGEDVDDDAAKRAPGLKPLARSDILSTSVLALACAYLLVMYYA